MKKYLPPKWLFDQVKTDVPKRKKVVILASILKWCLNDKGISLGGASFIQRILGLKSVELHDFFNYKYRNKIFDTGYIIEVQDTIPVPNISIDELSGVIETFKRFKNRPGIIIMPHEVKSVMQAFVKWLVTSDGMEYASKILDFGIALVDDSDAYLRLRTEGNVITTDIYKPFRSGDFQIIEMQSFGCEGCGNMTPCISEFNGQRLCRRCISQLTGNFTEDCQHIECFLYECQNSSSIR